MTLSCDVQGNPSPSISWTKNGIVIATGDDSRISFTKHNTNLTITIVGKADSGELMPMCGEQQPWNCLLKCCYIVCAM